MVVFLNLYLIEFRNSFNCIAYLLNCINTVIYIFLNFKYIAFKGKIINCSGVKKTLLLFYFVLIFLSKSKITLSRIAFSN